MHLLTSTSIISFLTFNPLLGFIIFSTISSYFGYNHIFKVLYYLGSVSLLSFYLYMLLYNRSFFFKILFHNLFFCKVFILQLVFVNKLKRFYNLANFFVKFLSTYLIGVLLLHFEIVCSLGWNCDNLYYFVGIPFYLIKKLLEINK